MVRWTPVEKLIIDDPYFQRLRRIKQLGLANLVFPGAEHTRFSHCIGTMAIAGRICEQLRLLPSEQQLVRLAALLHDVGHLPLSHLLERVYKERCKEEKAITAEKEMVASSSQKDEVKTEAHPKSHEDISSIIARIILHRSHISPLLEPLGILPEEVGDLINGTHQSFFLKQLIHSDLDVDQMDYMLRDGKHTGTVYSNFDLNYLIDSLTVVRQQTKETIRRVLCVKRRGLRAAEHYILASYFYYTQILFHKTRVMVEKIAEILYARLLENNLLGFPLDYKELQQLVESEEFYYFDDIRVLEKFKQVISDHRFDSDTRYLAKILFERKPLPEMVKEQIQFAESTPQKPIPRRLKKEAPDHPYLSLYTENEQQLKLISSEEERSEAPIYILYDPNKYVQENLQGFQLDDGKFIVALSEFPNTLVSPLKSHALLIERIYKPSQE